ncbi:MAG: metallophosphoesterase [Meiothermus sp.]|nr:metallophosphoesterase [Meiothermus sp.]
MNRRRFLSAAGLTGLAVVGASSLAVAGAYRFEVTKHQRTLAKLTQPIRVLQLSDLHFGPYIHADSVKVWVGAALEQHPDLILITGDILDTASHQDSVRGRLKATLSTEVGLLLAEIKQLKAPLGVFAVWGNHDYAAPDEMARFERELEGYGIHVLTNRGRLVRPDLYVAGVDDLWYGRPDAHAAMAECPEAAASILMCHNPDYLPGVPAAVDLTLCGHTHGGQLHFPLLGSPWTPSRYGQRFRAGWSAEPVSAYVSTGLGVSGIPLRNVPAEMAVFELAPEARA